MSEALVLPNRSQRSRILKKVGIGLAGLSLVAACSDGGSNGTAGAESDSNSVASVTNVLVSNSTQPAEGVPFTFNDRDDRPGQDVDVAVYHGFEDSSEARAEAGRYWTGTELVAVCKAPDGREVTTNPDNGDEFVSTNDWAGVIMPETGNIAYATRAYGDIEETAYQALPGC